MAISQRKRGGTGLSIPIIRSRWPTPMGPNVSGSLSETVKKEVRAVRREVDPSKVFDFEGEDGELMLRSSSDSMEYVRLRADRKFPRLSRAVSIGAVVGVLGFIAAFERALTMRYNKIVDADPWWL